MIELKRFPHKYLFIYQTKTERDILKSVIQNPCEYRSEPNTITAWKVDNNLNNLRSEIKKYCPLHESISIISK